MRASSGGPLLAAMFERCRCFNPTVFALLLVHLGTPVTAIFTEDLGVTFFDDHIRALTESFDSKLADAGNILVGQLRP